MSGSYCHGCGILKSEGVVHTCGQYAKSSDPVPVDGLVENADPEREFVAKENATFAASILPVEGVVLPERPKHVTRNTEDGPVLYHSYVAAEKHFKLLETKLAEAIAQRDAARIDRDMTQVSFGKILLEANQWKDRATKAEELLREHKTTYDLNLATLQRNHEIDRADWEPVLIERVRVAEAALAAMTEDRNLWQNAHDEDCPNKAALATDKARNFNFSGDNGV